MDKSVRDSKSNGPMTAKKQTNKQNKTNKDNKWMTIIVHQKQNKIIKKVKKRALRDRSGEHGRAIQNKTNDAVPQDFDQKGHKLTDIELTKLLKVLKYSPHERGFLRLK